MRTSTLCEPSDPPRSPSTEPPLDDLLDDLPTFEVPVDEDLLIHIAKLARIFTIGRVAKRSRPDVAQDIVLDCLVKMRAGEWDVPPNAVDSYVFRAVELKAFDLIRRRKRLRQRELEHGRELDGGTHAWMRPDTSGEDRELHAFYSSTLESLTPACKRTYVMVREHGMTYEEAAQALGISRSAVSANLVRAQRVFREQLLARGMLAPPAAKGGRYPKVDPIIYEPRDTP
jgi:RNA polymerase sigma factor (sigma-70 family)